METIWNVKPVNRQAVLELAYELELPRPAAAVCLHRGLDTPEKFREFCEIDTKKFHNPFLLPDIKPALERLCQAIDNQEKIYIHGDYDVDGVSSTCVIALTLKKLGANFEAHVPHRMIDGYDLKNHIVDQAIEAGAKLLMTVDCGIRALDVIAYAKTLNLDVIVTDHHIPREDNQIPNCIAVINPSRHDSKYPFRGLAGVGVAFKVMAALVHKRGGSVKELKEELLEYVALGTVADVMPMVDENRILVSMGCEYLSKTTRPGVQKLLEVAGVKDVKTQSIGFYIGPRINAIGRLDASEIALNLLLEKSSSRAAALANQLETANARRQSLQEQTVKEAIALLPDDMSKVGVIVVSAKGWHIGLVGLVAGKLSEKFGRPSLCISVLDDTFAKGSSRSYGSFHMLDCFNQKGITELFNKYGGHSYATGFDLHPDNIDLVRERMNAHYFNVMGDVEPVKKIDIDAIVFPHDIALSTYQAVNKLAPFGNDNPEPLYLVKSMRVTENKMVGKEEKHFKMKLIGSDKFDREVSALGWFRGHIAAEFPVGSVVDIVFKLSEDEWMGRTSLTMIIEDIRLSKGDV